MSRRLLINAEKPEEIRIAILDGNRLETYQVEVAEGGISRGNIYRGIVANIQPSLNAAFIDYGAPKDGFLSIQDVVDEAWQRKPKNAGRPRIDEVLERGKPVLVQVSKDMDGKKGGALTTNISLAGRFLVLTPFDATRGVSRKVEDEDMRKQLREQAESLSLPEGSGFIIRTNALEQNKTTLSRDFNAVARLWKTIQAGAKKGNQPALLHDDQDIVVRALRDFVDARIEEVLVDTDEAYEKAREYMRVFMPRTKTKLIRYVDREPLFSRFDVEKHIHGIYDRKVQLPGGGSIVIDRTEALTAIDVNSGRSTKAGSQEETALHTNIEAAAEIARQLRLRDIGGLVVVDFIDMRGAKHNQKVEKELQEAMKVDKARHTVGRISGNGLVEINRQRIRKELNLQTHRPCPTCDGTGRIASTEMVGLNLLRQIESHAATSRLESVRIELHPELADAMQNQRRRQIAAIEQEFDIRIEIIASNRLHRPEQVIEWNERPKGEGERHEKRHEGKREHEQHGRRGPKQEAKKDKAHDAHPEPLIEPDLDLDAELDDDLELDEEMPAESLPAGDAAPLGEKKGRRRRRRRRGKGGTDAHADAAHAAGAAHPPVAGATADSAHAHEPVALTFDWGEPGEEHEGGAESDAGEADSEAAPAVPGQPAKRRRRRGGRGRSRRREAGGAAPNGIPGDKSSAPASTPVAATAAAHPTENRSEAAAPASAEAEPGKKAPKKRGRRRGGRGRKPSDPGAGGVSSPAHES